MLKKLLPIILLASTYLIGQSYEFFDNAYYDSKGAVSWIWDGSHPMLISWNIKYLSENLLWVVVCISFYLVALNPSRINKLAALEYLLYRIIDILSYFWNFKTTHYWYVFIILGTIMAVIYLKNHATKKRNEKTSNIR